MEPPPPLEDLLKEPKPQDAPPQDLKGLVPNKGSEARDHCVRAGHHFERLRLGVTSFGLGIVLIGWTDQPPVHNGLPTGIIFLVLGFMFLCFATWRYFGTLHILLLGFGHPMTLSLGLLSAAIFFGGISVIVFAAIPNLQSQTNSTVTNTTSSPPLTPTPT